MNADPLDDPAVDPLDIPEVDPLLDRASGWPAVSVVMPVRNEARDLVESVEQILAQEYGGDLEVVLAVAPSTDGTERIADEARAYVESQQK